jgi:two-component system, NtrC family, sensor kinase
MNGMKLILKIALLLLFPFVVVAQPQQKQLDSLGLAIKNATNDTIRMGSSQFLASFYLEINRDSSFFYNKQALLLARKLKLKLNEADILDAQGYLFYNLGNFPEALKSSLLALKIAEDPLVEKGPFTLQWQRFKTPGSFRLGLLASIHHNLGHLYYGTGNRDKQILSYRESERIAASNNDSVLLALIYKNLTWVYTELNQLDSALIFGQKSLDYFSGLSFSDRMYEGDALSNIGNIYLKMGNFVLAKQALIKSVQLSEKQHNLTSLGWICISLAKLYKLEIKTDSSIFYAKKALDNFKAVGATYPKVAAYDLLFSMYNEQHKKDSAFAYLQLANAIKDSLNKVDKKNLQAFQNVGFDEQLRLRELEKETIQAQNKFRIYAMLAGSGVFLAIGLILYRNNRQKQKANKVLETTLSNLKSAQSQLIQAEKMASLGELTAGIAHEIQNPLNFVNNFSEVNTELLVEMKDEIDKRNMDEVRAIANDIISNEQKINYHGKRADAIVKGMLQHSRSRSGIKEPTDINKLADEYLRLAYHGLRAKDKSFNAVLKTDFDESIGSINIIPQDIGRVILNLITNAFYVVNEKALSAVATPAAAKYEPTVSVITKKIGDRIEIKVTDNGNGIPQKILDKIFQPFFTTKPTGQGTGLGLSLSYDIVKAHGGELKVETKEGEGTEFIILLPI